MLAAVGESQSASGLKTDCRRSTLISLIFGLDNGEYLIERSLARVLSFVRTQQREELNQRVLTLLEQVQTSQTAAPLDCLIVKQAGRVQFVRVEEIDWLEAAGVYVQVHTADKTWLHRISLSELEGKLDPRQFLRIHRSTIINRQRVKELQPHSHLARRHGTETQSRVSRESRSQSRPVTLKPSALFCSYGLSQHHGAFRIILIVRNRSPLSNHVTIHLQPTDV